MAKNKFGGFDFSKFIGGMNDNQEPCCQGKCTNAGEEKYWSIAKGILGQTHCGECCMDPSKYNLYHFFEKNLTKSQSDNPCKGFGFTKYDSTVTHGFGPVKMTLDLYDLPGEAKSPGSNFVFNREYHHEDVQDNQCFQADFPTSCYLTSCAPMAGVTDKGACPDKYNVKKSSRNEEVCRDGSNIKYCTDKIEVTVTTYGVGAANSTMDDAPPPEPATCKTDSDCPCSYW